MKRKGKSRAIAMGPVLMADGKTSPPDSETAPRRRDRRRIAFRLLVVVFPFIILAGLELLLRVLGIGYSTSLFLPWREGDTDLWVSNSQFTRRLFPLTDAPQPRPFSFSARKDPGTIRIFILGESAALGEPEPQFGFASMLQILLKERYPDQRFEVVNLGIVAINSHIIREIAREAAQREGDLWVVYMGNNEMVGPFGSVTVMGAKAPRLSIARATLALKKTRIGQSLDLAVQRLRPSKPSATEWHGMATFHEQRVRHDDWLTARVHSNFQRNLQDVMEASISSRTPVLLCTVGTNLEDCPPFASLHAPGISEPDLGRWQAAYDSGKAAEAAGRHNDALASYQSAAKIDATHADLQFRMGRCLVAIGQHEEARRCFERARDYDALQFRADRSVNNSIRQSASSFSGEGVHLVDIEELMADQSPNEIIGSEFFLEHVHLTPEGNYFLARTLAGDIEALLGSRLGTNQNASRPDWLSEPDCYAALGFADFGRHDLLSNIERLIAGPPFNPADYPHALKQVREEIERLRPATKLSRVRTFIPELRRTVEKHPEIPDLHANLAEALELCSDFSGAEAEWHVVTKLLPHSALAFFKLASVQERQGRIQQAVASYRACLRRQANYPSAKERLEILLEK